MVKARTSVWNQGKIFFNQTVQQLVLESQTSLQCCHGKTVNMMMLSSIPGINKIILLNGLFSLWWATWGLILSKRNLRKHKMVWTEGGFNAKAKVIWQGKQKFDSWFRGKSHHSKRKHHTTNCVTTDAMLQNILPSETWGVFDHMVTYKQTECAMTKLLGVCTHFCEVLLLKRVGIKNIMSSFHAAWKFICASWFNASLKFCDAKMMQAAEIPCFRFVGEAKKKKRRQLRVRPKYFLWGSGSMKHETTSNQWVVDTVSAKHSTKAVLSV